MPKKNRELTPIELLSAFHDAVANKARQWQNDSAGIQRAFGKPGVAMLDSYIGELEALEEEMLQAIMSL